MTNIRPLKKIAWDDFYKDIELLRYRGRKQVKYVGNITVDNIKYTSEFILDRAKFDENTDQLSFIDGFVKEQIANDLAKQINYKVMSCR